MHFDAAAAARGDHRDVRGDHRIDLRRAGRIKHPLDFGHVLVKDDRIDREIGLDAVLVHKAHDLGQVFDRKGARGKRTHVELAHAEIHRIGSGLNGRRQRFARARGRHEFKVASLHVGELLVRVDACGCLPGFDYLRSLAPAAAAGSPNLAVKNFTTRLITAG